MNLYLSHRERARKKFLFRLKIYALAIILILIMGLLYYLTAWTPFFKIQSIEVAGQGKLSKQNIIRDLTYNNLGGLAAMILGYDSLFIWPSGPITINNYLISQANVIKSWFDRKITVNLQERDKYGLLCSETNACFWFDRGGFVFDKALATEDEKLFVKIVSSSPKLGAKIVKEELFPNLQKIMDFLRENFLITNFQLDQENYELIAKTVNGTKLLLNIRFDSENNLKALKEISKKTYFTNLEYVDLRVENRIYYK